jgi:hypothetical protein
MILFCSGVSDVLRQYEHMLYVRGTAIHIYVVYALLVGVDSVSVICSARVCNVRTCSVIVCSEKIYSVRISGVRFCSVGI